MLDFKLALNHDLRKLGCNLDNVYIMIKPYSKTAYGRYYPSHGNGKARVVIYAHKDRNGEPYPYKQLLLTTVHELTHHEQYMNPKFKRIKGVMHNEEFYEIYGRYEKLVNRMYGGVENGL